jgi:predicted Zn-dependent protease
VFLLKLLEDGYAPGVELEVDRKALNLAREAGYSPAALVSLLEKFTMGGGSWSSHLESAAPGLERRIAQAERLVGYRKAKGGGPSR